MTFTILSTRNTFFIFVMTMIPNTIFASTSTCKIKLSQLMYRSAGNAALDDNTAFKSELSGLNEFLSKKGELLRGTEPRLSVNGTSVGDSIRTFIDNHGELETQSSLDWLSFLLELIPRDLAHYDTTVSQIQVNAVEEASDRLVSLALRSKIAKEKPVQTAIAIRRGRPQINDPKIVDEIIEKALSENPGASTWKDFANTQLYNKPKSLSQKSFARLRDALSVSRTESTASEMFFTIGKNLSPQQQLELLKIARRPGISEEIALLLYSSLDPSHLLVRSELLKLARHPSDPQIVSINNNLLADLKYLHDDENLVAGRVDEIRHLRDRYYVMGQKGWIAINSTLASMGDDSSIKQLLSWGRQPRADIDRKIKVLQSLDHSVAIPENHRNAVIQLYIDLLRLSDSNNPNSVKALESLDANWVEVMNPTQLDEVIVEAERILAKNPSACEHVYRLSQETESDQLLRASLEAMMRGTPKDRAYMLLVAKPDGMPATYKKQLADIVLNNLAEGDDPVKQTTLSALGLSWNRKDFNATQLTQLENYLHSISDVSSNFFHHSYMLQTRFGFNWHSRNR